MRATFSLFLLPTIFLMGNCREKVDVGAPPSNQITEKGGSAESDKEFVGLTEAAGTSLAKSLGLTPRVVSVDGEQRPTTRDYRLDRVNFELEGGKVVRVTRG